MPVTYSTHETALVQAQAVVDHALEAFNHAQPALQDVQPLHVFAKQDDAQIIGGAVGRTWGQCCELQQLWVHEALRRQGIGARLLSQFEHAAAQRGCMLVYLETFSFQAPAFYRRCGYTVVLTTRGFTQGVEKYVMRKDLARS
jgi:GNAT superfamily N-acetyltransferase